MFPQENNYNYSPFRLIIDKVNIGAAPEYIAAGKDNDIQATLTQSETLIYWYLWYQANTVLLVLDHGEDLLMTTA